MSGADDTTKFVAYKSRWLVLGTVCLLTVSSNLLWISFATINITSATYFNKSPTDINFLTSVGFLVGLPVGLFGTYFMQKLGLRGAVLVAQGLTFVGGLIRFLGTAPFIVPFDESETEPLEFQYWICVVAQLLIGAANPIICALPTTVSQPWFPESEVKLVTAILSSTLPVGTLIGFGLTPLLFKEEQDVQTMNWVWFIPAVISTMCTAVTFYHNSSRPPTPPSKSAASGARHEIGYWKCIKALATNPSFIVVVLTVGGSVGFFNTVLTLLQQFTCSRGYSNEFSGLCGSLLLGLSFVGAGASSYIVTKTGRLIETAKIIFGLAGLVGIVMMMLLREPGQEVALATCFALLGIICFGVYPLGLELVVESIYPIDMATGSVLLYFWGSLLAFTIVTLSGMLDQDLTDAASQIETCSEIGGEDGVEDDGIYVGRDHTRTLMLMAGSVAIMASAFIILANNEGKRTRANIKKIYVNTTALVVDPINEKL